MFILEFIYNSGDAQVDFPEGGGGQVNFQGMIWKILRKNQLTLIDKQTLIILLNGPERRVYALISRYHECFYFDQDQIFDQNNQILKKKTSKLFLMFL